MDAYHRSSAEHIREIKQVGASRTADTVTAPKEHAAPFQGAGARGARGRNWGAIMRCGRIGSMACRVIGGVALLMSAGILVAPRMSNNEYSPVWLLLAVAASAAAFAGWMCRGRRRESRFTDRAWNLIIGIVGALMVMATGFVAWWGAYIPTWDARLIKTSSGRPPETYSTYMVDYFSRYPNNHAVLALGRLARQGERIGLDYEATFALMNTASLALAGLAMVATVRMLAGPRRALAAMIALFVLIGLSPWVSVPYTDVSGVWAPPVAVFLFVYWARAGRKAGRIVAALAFGGVLAIGYVLRIFPVVGLVAAALALLLAGRSSARLRARPSGVAFVALSVTAFFVTVQLATAASTVVADLPPLKRGISAAPLMYVAAGVRVQTSETAKPTYGGFDREVNRRTWAKSHDEQNRISRHYIEQAWDRRGPVGTARFMASKMLFLWGDGMFWARGEGTDMDVPPLRHGWQSDLVAAVNTPNGAAYAVRVHVAQVLWVVLLMAAGWGLLRGRCRREVLLMAVTIAGIAAFTLLFLGRSRYLLGDVPVLIALALTALPARRPAPRRGDGKRDHPRLGHETSH
ncbi:hypothetical protein ACIBG5_14025 [Kribbella sp. NPDC050241]|uniref:hypothetical protein n=1 Tax=Kribbella sp. NPDC050241 TaxID=3364115 RepID=UPI00379312EB